MRAVNLRELQIAARREPYSAKMHLIGRFQFVEPLVASLHFIDGCGYRDFDGGDFTLQLGDGGLLGFRRRESLLGVGGIRMSGVCLRECLL